MRLRKSSRRCGIEQTLYLLYETKLSRVRLFYLCFVYGAKVVTAFTVIKFLLRFTSNILFTIFFKIQFLLHYLVIVERIGVLAAYPPVEKRLCVAKFCSLPFVVNQPLYRLYPIALDVRITLHFFYFLLVLRHRAT